MKRFGLVWCCLGLGLLAGCSSSVANHDDMAAGRSAVSTPEWVSDEPEQPSVTLAAKVQPIPETTDETPDDNSVQAVKPFPDDAEN
jgi:hypothetical protein